MIKRLFSFSLLLSVTQLTFAQALPNGGFESWTTTSFETPDYYHGSSPEALVTIGQNNCTKTSDKQNGSFAIKLETIASSTDTIFGYYINGEPEKFTGGSPYSQSPTTISGYYKCNVQAGDSAILLVVFKKAGVPIAQNIFYFTGSKSTYTAFSYSLNPILIAPDSVIIGAASSNALANKKNPGSVLQLDNLSFGGAGITQAIPNGDFENWTATNIEEPAGWNTRNLNAYADQGIPQVSKLLAPYSGAYAMQMTTLMLGGGNYFVFDASTGKFTHNGYDNGRPYTQISDTLTGYYKYLPSNNDTASIMVTCFKNGASVGGGYKTFVSSTTTYTKFELLISCSQTPDSMRIDLYSSSYPLTISQVGSAFIVDNLSLQSDPLGIYFLGYGAKVSVFPNPAVNELHFNIKGITAQAIEILDINGKSIETLNVAGTEQFVINTQSYAAGNYFYKLSDKTSVVSRGRFNVVK